MSRNRHLLLATLFLGHALVRITHDQGLPPGIAAEELRAAHTDASLLAPPDDLRTEHFLLRLKDPAGSARVVGGVRQVRSTVGGVLLLEAETELFGVRARVKEVEELGSESGPKLVFRELRDRAGRTLVLDADPEDEVLRCTEWVGGAAPRRRELFLEPETYLSAELLEEIRRGAESTGAIRVFDPLAGDMADLIAVTRRGFLAGPVPWTVVTWRRADDTLAGSWIFLGNELCAFRRQAGGPVAVRVRAEAYEAALAAQRLEGETREPEEPEEPVQRP